jgi:hypothetical protein
MKKITRRKFMKDTLAAGTALTAFPAILTCAPRNAAAGNKTVVHPNVDNLRVVSLTDPKMTTSSKPICDWATQNKLVNSTAVFENLDKLACELSQTHDIQTAWKTIFVKPPQKSWKDTVVAIKTNNIAYQHTRSAVIAKICYTFTNVLGVAPQNIHIYDAKHGKDMTSKTPFTGLPQGCRVEGHWGGITADVSVPKPWKRGREKSKCLRHLADGSLDILVNIAVCKGHNPRFGGFSLTMKNHLGTFWPTPVHQDGGGLDYIIAVNKTPEILGRTDSHSGQIIYPRQQLCIVDALWASKRGPGGFPSDQPNFLAMGVLSPIVDYVVARQFRGERMGWKPNMKLTDRLLTEFGYSQADLPNKGRLIEI